MNPLGSSKEIVINKLIILYMLNKLSMPVSNPQLTRLILENRLMNYFMFQQCFNELHKSNLVQIDVNNSAAPGSGGFGPDKNMRAEEDANTCPRETPGRFVPTEAGNNTLNYFLNLVPSGMKKQLDRIAHGARKDIRDEVLITADFFLESEDKFGVILKTAEKDFPLLELKATVGTKNDALNICENWKKHSPEIYSEIIDSLTKRRG